MRQTRYLNYILFFLVSPILSFFIALKKYKNPSMKNIFWIFCAFFGFCIDLNFQSGTNDAIVYVGRFYYLHDNNVSIDYLFSNFLSNRNHIEIVSDLIGFIVAQFTRDYHYLYATFGFCFGYFQSRNLDYFIRIIKNSSYDFTWLLGGFILTIPVWYINGFDFWFATQVYIFMMLPVIIEKKYNRLYLMVILPFIHFSFLFLIIITAFLLIFIKFENSVFVLFYFSLFSFFFDFTFFFQFLDFLPEIFSSRTSAYLNADTSVQEGGRIIWWFNNIYNLSLYFYVIYLFKTYNTILKSDSGVYRVILYSFAFVGFFNLISSVPSVGRFIYIGMSFMWGSLIIVVGKIEKRIQEHNRYITILKIMIFLAFCLNLLRYIFPLVGIGKLLSNIFTIYLFIDDDLNIGNLLF